MSCGRSGRCRDGAHRCHRHGWQLVDVAAVLESLEHQSQPRVQYELLVVDDGSTDGTARWCASWRDGGFGATCARIAAARLSRETSACSWPGRRWCCSWTTTRLPPRAAQGACACPQRHSGCGDGCGRRVDVAARYSPTPSCTTCPWSNPSRSRIRPPPRQLSPPVAHFRSRQLSAKRGFLAQRGLHASHFGLLADVELGHRLVYHGLTLRFWSHARSERVTIFSFDDWCEQLRQRATPSSPSPPPMIVRRCGHVARSTPPTNSGGGIVAHYDGWREQVRRLEVELGATYAEHPDKTLLPLWRLYRECFAASRIRGVAEALSRRP